MSTRTDPSTGPKTFDPFGSRICRNARNELAEALMRAIRGRRGEPVRAAAAPYRTADAPPAVRRYVESRLERYADLIARLPPEAGAEKETHAVAAQLWDRELFFELHEWLEQRWHRSRGDERALLQALIRAAGVYIHLEQGRAAAARKLADKALSGLAGLRVRMPAPWDADALVDALRRLDSVPPKSDGKAAAGPADRKEAL